MSGTPPESVESLLASRTWDAPFGLVLSLNPEGGAVDAVVAAEEDEVVDGAPRRGAGGVAQGLSLACGGQASGERRWPSS